MRKVIILLILLLPIFLYFFFQKRTTNYVPPKSQIKQEEIYRGISYEAVNPDIYQITLLSNKLVSPTRLRLTPDGQHLLVSQITGEILSFDRIATGWSETPYLVTRIDTKFPGFPPDEAGLTGIVLSKNFDQNGKLFLLYTYKDKDGTVQNRVSVTLLKDVNGKLKGTQPELIYQANVAGAGSHQITDGASLDINNQPHLLLAIGEGFDSKRAQDPNLEGGKIILIQEDGRDPLGIRPYENSKIEVVGIRNAYVMANNPDTQNSFLIADLGPDKYDRLIYTKVGTGAKLNFNWNGDPEKLKEPIPDPNDFKIKDMIVYRLPEPMTFTGLKFFPDRSNQILAVLFGQTGSTQNSPGKEIWLGKMTNPAGQPKISFETIIKRVKEADGKLGNPIGLEIDPQTNNFFFADIMEGRVYMVGSKEEKDK